MTDKKANMITMSMITVIIDRDAHTKLPATVYEYEVPVLEELYGAANISIVDEKDVEVDTSEFRAVDAHAALLNKYSQHMDVVRAVYPRVRTLARESGLPYQKSDEAAAKFNQSQELVGGKKVDSKTTSQASGGVESDEEREDRLAKLQQDKADRQTKNSKLDAEADAADTSATKSTRSKPIV